MLFTTSVSEDIWTRKLFDALPHAIFSAKYIEQGINRI